MGEENCGAESKNSQVTQLCLYTMLEIPVFPTRRVKLDCLGQFLEAGDWTNGLSQALPLNLEAEGAKKQPCFPLVTGSPVANTQPLPNPLPSQWEFEIGVSPLPGKVIQLKSQFSTILPSSPVCYFTPSIAEPRKQGSEGLLIAGGWGQGGEYWTELCPRSQHWAQCSSQHASKSFPWLRQG